MTFRQFIADNPVATMVSMWFVYCLWDPGSRRGEHVACA